jgi:hypothetical protein
MSWLGAYREIRWPKNYDFNRKIITFAFDIDV